MLDIISFIDGKIFESKHPEGVTRFYFTAMPMFGVEKYLLSFGVAIAGRRLEKGGRISFLVSKKQDAWAEQLCFRMNYPKIGTLYPKNEKYRGLGAPKKKWEEKGRKGGALFSLGRFVNSVGKFFEDG